MHGKGHDNPWQGSANISAQPGLLLNSWWLVHEALPAGCLEFLLIDSSVIVSIDLRKVSRPAQS